ncbi:MAG TPA: Cof-type HAD-IIB family hydrolase [Candidatus Lachnoclostridium stercoripullorum]|uniref:Cof-type HAD-IIB family hydrolase n=1 Tax=Candidatus Lachnoclostridium stercoripullorum TaxID=2838635 RepID=A0A9D2AVB4_9FIRM|nr:Cof-type HAD-IIB family hydrolase [Candidatus Lachnoclostridium stercoripullorum]
MRLIALDLDGTLLNDEKELTEENRKALAECMERGIYIVPTTGRTLEGIPAEIKNIPGIRYAITVNGGRIMDKDQNITIDSRLLTREQALQVIDIAEEYPVMYDAYVNGRGVSESRFLDHLEEYGISGAGLKSIRAVRDAYPNIRGHIETCGEMVEKLNIFFKDVSCREEIRRRIEDLGFTIVSSSVYNNLEINAKGATKGEAILRLADYLGIPKEETMAFGDGENDFTMIDTVELGVAMGNAADFLKERADYITLSNNESGVAYAIRKFVLGSEA